MAGPNAAPWGFNVTLGAWLATSAMLVWLRASSSVAGNGGNGQGHVLHALFAKLCRDHDLLELFGIASGVGGKRPTGHAQ